jgi:unsaturated chondroitin disaccharide hydrolase
MATAEHDADLATLESTIEFALGRIDDNLEPFRDSFPTEPETGLTYEQADIRGSWTAGFWPGLLWAAHEHTGADRYRQVADWLLPHFAERLHEGDAAENHHDLGFLYTHGALAAHDVTGRKRARDLAIEAADQLVSRFHSAPGVIQAWGDHRPPNDEVRIIVDTMMNLPLLYRVASMTGRDRLAEIAETHADTAADVLLRDDGSTAHTYWFDAETGEPLRQETGQGLADDSTWTRGQAWAIYGYALSYRHTGRDRFRDVSARTADHFLDRLPDDGVPPWDFDSDEQEIRDSSAAAIAANGLLELAGHLPATDGDRDRYEAAALDILQSLATAYTTAGEDSNAVLAHGTAHRTEGQYDQPLIYGDYYFLSALLRATDNWTPFAAR